MKDKPKNNSSFYVPFDVTANVIERHDGIQRGSPCRIEGLNKRFAWMPGHVNGFYGWASDGKSTMADFISVVKAKVDDWGFCLFKPEDMDSIFNSSTGECEIKANAIYKDLAWSLTGIPWDPEFAEKNKVRCMTEDEEMAAIKIIRALFFVIYPEERDNDALIEKCHYMVKTYKKIRAIWIDPWNEIELDNDERGDDRLSKPFRKWKRFALKTNTVVNIISHPKTMQEQKEKDGSYKVVNQYMQLGGGMWDVKMDGQFSKHRPFRHRDPNDPNAHFYNLKQKQAARVGVKRGVVENIVFDELKRAYYFNGINPMDGTFMPAEFVASSAPPSPPANKYRKKKEPESFMYGRDKKTVGRDEPIFGGAPAPPPPKATDETPF